MTTPILDEATIFNMARQIHEPKARRSYLDRVCGHDKRLLARIVALLRIHDNDPGFLESPAVPKPVGTEPVVNEGPGTHIGAYKLVAQMGEGGFGVVFLAEQEQPIRRTVALKILKPGMDSRQVVARFEAERQILAVMDHPNIARVLDGGETISGRSYFVMELVNGLPITRYCDDRQLTPRERLGLFVRVCQAVQHAHQKGVIHRDLKPTNVLVTVHDGRPVPKVIDFGVAKALGRELAERTLTGPGGIIGTLEYMSPEAAEFNARDIDTRADIYSLGVVLYELLTGTTPLSRARLDETPISKLLQAIREEEPPKPSARLTDSKISLASIASQRKLEPALLTRMVRGELDWIVMKALEKDRSRRYATANGLARDIERYLQGEAVEACPPSAWYKVRKFAGKHRRLLGAAAAFMTLLTGGIFVSLWLAVRATQAEHLASRERDRAEAETRRAKRQLYAADMNLAQSAWEDGQVARVAQLLELTGPTRGGEDLRGFEWHYWKRLTDMAVLTLRGHSKLVWSVVFSPDGKRLASGSQDGTVRIWDGAIGSQTAVLKGHRDEVFEVAFSPDGTRLASASGDGLAKVWDVASGSTVLTLQGHTERVWGVAFSPDGKQLATASHDRTVRLWDVSSGKQTRVLQGHGDLVMTVAFSPDGKWLASAGKDKMVRIWDAASGRETLTLPGHTDEIYSVAFSPDGQQLASASWDRTIKLWNASSGREIRALEGHRERVFSVAFSPDGKRLASASFDRTVKIWNAASGEEILTLKGHTYWVSSVAFSPNGRRLASASADETVKIWDAAPGQTATQVMREGHPCDSVAFSSDGRRLASGGSGKVVRIWDAASSQELLTLKGHTGRILSVGFSPDGKELVSAAEDRTVRLWDAKDGHELLRLKGSSGQVAGVAFSPDGKRLAAASEDETVRVWELPGGRELMAPRGHVGAVTAVTYSPDGKWLASGGTDKTVKVWEAATGQELLTLTGHTGPITSVVFSPDGKQLASASGDITIKLWDAASGREISTLAGHTRWVASVAFSPDGKRLATAGHDRTVKVWDTVSGQETLTLKGHTHDAVSGVVFSPDGLRLASSSYDRTVRLWDARPWTPKLRLEQEARSLIRALYAETQSCLQVIEQIKRDTTLRPEVRQEALAMIERCPAR
jgi:WD40 repeat protein/serine/threonine protein kinase